MSVDYMDIRKRYLRPEGITVVVGEEKKQEDKIIYITKDELYRLVDELTPSKIVIDKGIGLESKELLNIISTKKSLKFIRMPNDYLPLTNLPSDDVNALWINPFCDKELFNGYQEYSWDLEHVMPNVEFFSFMDGDGRYDLAGVTSKAFPNLKWIECMLDKKGRTLETLQNFSNLSSVYLHEVWNHRIFSALKEHQIKRFRLEGFTRGFSFEDITNFTEVEVLKVNGYREHFDMQLLAKLPIKEISFISCIRMEHVDVLLQIPTLERLTIIDCKKPLTQEMKEVLKEKLLVADVDFQ
ncbi:hypothetical protein [Paenibacillus massiliensis]|uniref:hypothetical protein n=1 Tax=Paenibacillus massiliensis TaxID=225917 RepID=UPI00048C545E|nr:hypothetical protein [Paenibacillus massiliensis]